MQQENIFPNQIFSSRTSQIPLHTPKAYLYTIIITLSMVYFGYAMTLISSSSLPMLFNYYNITLSKTVTVALLNGILPLGAVLGALFVPLIVPLTTKKRIHYFLTAATVAVCGVSVIPSFYAVLVGRFALGFLISHYQSVSSGYIRQTFPDYLRNRLGAVYSCGRPLGILICYINAQVSDYTDDEVEHIVVFFGPAFIAVFQSFLIWKFLPESIIEMIKLNKPQEVQNGLRGLYDEKDISKRWIQLKSQVEMNRRMTIVALTQKFSNPKNLTALHLGLLRQFCGMSYIVVYAGQVISRVKEVDASITPVVINLIQLVAGLAGIWIVGVFSRGALILSSSWLMGVINLIIGVSDILEEPVFCIVMMSIFMIPCAAGLNSVVYAYPSELVVASQGKYASALSWIGSATVTLTPPFIVAAVPGNLAYPIFFFFAFYLGVACFINALLVEPLSKSASKSQQQ